MGRAVAQAVSRRLPTATTRVRAQVMSCRICSGQSGSGASSLRVMRFPLPILIPLAAPHSSSSIIRGCYNRPICGRRTKWTQSHPRPGNLKKKTKSKKRRLYLADPLKTLHNTSIPHQLYVMLHDVLRNGLLIVQQLVQPDTLTTIELSFILTTKITICA
jgi:hypothetical protein